MIKTANTDQDFEYSSNNTAQVTLLVLKTTVK